MLKTLFKLAACALIIFGVYKGVQMYAAYKVAKYMNECGGTAKLCLLTKQKAANDLITAAVSELYVCTKGKQSSFEAGILPIPKMYTEPPAGSLSYRDAEKVCEVKS